jgi:hypothetical protein
MIAKSIDPATLIAGVGQRLRAKGSSEEKVKAAMADIEESYKIAERSPPLSDDPAKAERWRWALVWSAFALFGKTGGRRQPTFDEMVEVFSKIPAFVGEPQP